jgi:xanthine/uracil permease
LGNLELTSILPWLWRAIPVVIGGAGGYLFYRFVGCKTGACPITSNPWLSTIYGAVLGFLFAAR